MTISHGPETPQCSHAGSVGPSELLSNEAQLASSRRSDDSRSGSIIEEEVKHPDVLPANGYFPFPPSPKFSNVSTTLSYLNVVQYCYYPSRSTRTPPPNNEFRLQRIRTLRATFAKLDVSLHDDLLAKLTRQSGDMPLTPMAMFLVDEEPWFSLASVGTSADVIVYDSAGRKA
ncbi:hypothetical protein MMC11_008466 [Xylographa trunciseda]|nr:hypothetical protein [Xylographa trunciseda]